MGKALWVVFAACVVVAQVASSARIGDDGTGGGGLLAPPSPPTAGQQHDGGAVVVGGVNASTTGANQAASKEAKPAQIAQASGTAPKTQTTATMVLASGAAVSKSSASSTALSTKMQQQQQQATTAGGAGATTLPHKPAVASKMRVQVSTAKKASTAAASAAAPAVKKKQVQKPQPKPTPAAIISTSSPEDELSAPGNPSHDDCGEPTSCAKTAHTEAGSNVHAIKEAPPSAPAPAAAAAAPPPRPKTKEEKEEEDYQKSLSYLTGAEEKAETTPAPATAPAGQAANPAPPAAPATAVTAPAPAAPAAPAAAAAAPGGLQRVKTVHVVSPVIDDFDETKDSNGDVVADTTYDMDSGKCDCKAEGQPVHCVNMCSRTHQNAAEATWTRVVIPVAKAACSDNCATQDDSSDSSNSESSGKRLNSANLAPDRAHPTKTSDAQLGKALSELSNKINQRIRRRHKHLAALLGIPKDALRGRAEYMEHHGHATEEGYYQNIPKEHWKTGDALDPSAPPQTIPDPIY